MLVAVDFCLTLTGAVEPGNTGGYGICCFCVGVSGGVKGCRIGVVNGVEEKGLSATALFDESFGKLENTRSVGIGREENNPVLTQTNFVQCAYEEKIVTNNSDLGM